MSSRYKPDYSHGDGSMLSFGAVVWVIVMVLGAAAYVIAMLYGMSAESYGLSWQDIGTVMVIVGFSGFMVTLYLDSCVEMSDVRHVNAEWHPDKTSAPDLVR